MPNRAAVWIPPEHGYLLLFKLLICFRVSSIDLSTVSAPLKTICSVRNFLIASLEKTMQIIKLSLLQWPLVISFFSSFILPVSIPQDCEHVLHAWGFSCQGSRPAQRGCRCMVVRWLSEGQCLLCFPPAFKFRLSPLLSNALQLSLNLLSPDPDLPAWLPCLTPDQPLYYRHHCR